VTIPFILWTFALQGNYSKNNAHRFKQRVGGERGRGLIFERLVISCYVIKLKDIMAVYFCNFFGF
jgi:hypothetical protein